MAEIITNIKQRVLQIPENKGISKESFFKKIGVSYGNFKGKSKDSALSSDVLAEISTNYPEVSIEWLLLGVGNMEKELTTNSHPADDIQAKYINILEENNKLLKENLALKERLHKLGDSPKVASTRRHSA